jgi:hypothetical protein
MNGYLTNKQKWRKCNIKYNKIIPYKNNEYIPRVRNRNFNNTVDSLNIFDKIQQNSIFKIQGTIVKKKKVSFQNTVYVCLIPTKEEYNWFSL